jgi:hypothetical protein
MRLLSVASYYAFFLIVLFRLIDAMQELIFFLFSEMVLFLTIQKNLLAQFDELLFVFVVEFLRVLAHVQQVLSIIVICKQSIKQMTSI